MIFPAPGLLAFPDVPGDRGHQRKRVAERTRSCGSRSATQRSAWAAVHSCHLLTAGEAPKDQHLDQHRVRQRPPESTDAPRLALWGIGRQDSNSKWICLEEWGTHGETLAYPACPPAQPAQSSTSTIGLVGRTTTAPANTSSSTENSSKLTLEAPVRHPPFSCHLLRLVRNFPRPAL